MKAPYLFLVLPAAALLVVCCVSVTPARLAKIAPGMKADEVTARLGQPARIDHAEITGLTGDAYHYVSNGGDARVVFVNGVVFAREVVPGAKGS